MVYRQGWFLLFLMLFGFYTHADNAHLSFRQEVAAYIKAIEDNKPALDGALLDSHWNEAYQVAHWSLLLKRFCGGQELGQAAVEGEHLSQVLQTAVKKTFSASEAKPCHWQMTFYYAPNQSYAFLDSGQRLIGQHIAIDSVDVPLLKKQITDSRAYLMKVMDSKQYGFYKLYDVTHYKKQTQLRTIYTASSLYTLIKSEEVMPNPSIPFKKIAQFLLNAQVKKGVHQGAFYYAYHPRKQKYIPVLVVGSASKTIFTLLLLNQKYPEDKRYLNAASLAGDWLVRQVQADGQLITKWSYRKGRWVSYHRQSALYSGQVLSALSRLYRVTHNARYLTAATKIFNRFEAQLDKNLLLKDDYRPANSISSSWALMSLMDYAKAKPSARIHTRIKALAQFLVKRQNQTADDIYDYGRYWDAITPSGNGWINEVMGQVYHFCVENTRESSCTLYKDAMVRTSRWLIQNAYTQENTYMLKYPHRVIGGYMTGDKVQTIRTDAVCHGVNSMVDLYGIVRGHKADLLVLREQPFEEILSRLRMG